MSVFLNVLFIAVSVFYLTGRLYEINFVMDPRTGFLSGEAIVTSAVMMLIICLMAVCCGIIIFAAEKQPKRIKQMPVGVLGIMAGVFFVIGGIVSSTNCFKYGGFILYHMMEAVGGIGFILLGIMNKTAGIHHCRIRLVFIIGNAESFFGKKTQHDFRIHKILITA